LCLVKHEFEDAKAHFAKANKFYRKPKLSALNLLISFSPRLTVRLFQRMRPAEFSFISPHKAR
jgi:hypothetical protein